MFEEADVRPKRFDGFPTPGDLERFYAPHTSISSGEAEALGKKFKNTVIGEAMGILLEEHPSRINISDVYTEIDNRLSEFPDRIEVSLWKQILGVEHIDGLYSWELYRKNELVNNGNKHLDPDNNWEVWGNEVPDDVKEAAFAVKKHIEKLVPGFKDTTNGDQVDVVFLPGLEKGQYVLEQVLAENVGTIYTEPWYQIAEPDFGMFTFYQYSCIKDDRKSDLLFLQVEDRRDGEGQPKQVELGEIVPQYWLLPDIPPLPNEYFHVVPERKTRYADSQYELHRRVIYAPVPEQLQYYLK